MAHNITPLLLAFNRVTLSSVPAIVIIPLTSMYESL